jgi:transcriptional regulatory protein LEU3
LSVLYRRLQELEEEASTWQRQLSSAFPAAPDNPLPSGGAPTLGREENIHVLRVPVDNIARPREQSGSSDPTLPRTIDGLELAPGIIDDCFDL